MDPTAAFVLSWSGVWQSQDFYNLGYPPSSLFFMNLSFKVPKNQAWYFTDYLLYLVWAVHNVAEAGDVLDKLASSFLDEYKWLRIFNPTLSVKHAQNCI